MVAPRLATTFASGDPASVEAVSPVLDAISGPVGLHRRVRHRRAAEVHRQPAARGAHRGRRRGDGAGPAQRPGPGTGAADPEHSIASSAIWTAARPPDGRTPLVPRTRPRRHPASHPGADRRSRRPHSACPPRCSPPPRRSSTRPSPTGAATWTSPCVHDQVSGVRPRGPDDLVPGHLHRARAPKASASCAKTAPLVAPADLKRWATTMELLADWPAAEAGPARPGPRPTRPPSTTTRCSPPLRWPRKVICAGVNYRRHMREMGGEIPAGGWRPFFFLKAPTTSVIGPHDPIVIQFGGPRPVRLGGRTGRRHRYRGKRHFDRTGRGSRGRPTAWPTT